MEVRRFGEYCADDQVILRERDAVEDFNNERVFKVVRFRRNDISNVPIEAQLAQPIKSFRSEGSPGLTPVRLTVCTGRAALIG